MSHTLSLISEILTMFSGSIMQAIYLANMINKTCRCFLPIRKFIICECIKTKIFLPLLFENITTKAEGSIFGNTILQPIKVLEP
jgi:hypothetical protein